MRRLRVRYGVHMVVTVACVGLAVLAPYPVDLIAGLAMIFYSAVTLTMSYVEHKNTPCATEIAQGVRERLNAELSATIDQALQAHPDRRERSTTD